MCTISCTMDLYPLPRLYSHATILPILRLDVLLHALSPLRDPRVDMVVLLLSSDEQSSMDPEMHAASHGATNVPLLSMH